MNKFLNLNKRAAAMLMVGLTLLTGCGQTAETRNTIVSESAQTTQAEETVVGSEAVESESPESETAQNWYDAFGVDTQAITIYCSSDDYMQPVEITDSEQVTAIAASVDFSVWEERPLEEQTGDEPAYYVDFHNGTVIAISVYAESGYGEIGTACFFERNEDGTLTSWGLENGTGVTFTFNDGLYDAIVAAVQTAS